MFIPVFLTIFIQYSFETYEETWGYPILPKDLLFEYKKEVQSGLELLFYLLLLREQRTRSVFNA